MPVIDAHQHFWNYDPAVHAWINEEMSVIRKDFLPGDLKTVFAENNIEGCVAVQADQSEQETDFLLSLANDNPFIRGVVGWVDLRAVNIRERLAHYKQYPLVKGFRHILQGEDPAFMLTAEFRRGIAALKEFGYTYDILIFPKHLAASLELVQQFPEQKFVIDHIAKPDIKNGLLDNWEKGIRALAKMPNVYCKISGMVTEANWQTWTKEDLYPYLTVVTEAFGTKRLLYGSDWPVCLVAAAYNDMMFPVRDFYQTFSTEEQDAVFRKNAIEFYHL
jgi:L-fuconolactonase